MNTSPADPADPPPSAPGNGPAVSRQEFDALFEAVRTWGRWAPADRGAWNRVGPDHVRRAAALVRSGTVVPMGLPWNTRAGPDNAKPALHYMSDLGDVEAPEPSTHRDFIAVDYHGKGVSHLDALCHIAYRGQLYDGRAADQVVGATGARFGAVAELGPLVTRGVLLDLPAAMGVAWLEPGRLPRDRLVTRPRVTHRERPLHANRKTARAAAALMAVAATAVAGCQRGSSGGGGSSSTGPSRAGCPAALVRAEAAVRRAENAVSPWNGPTSGPKAASGKTIVYVAQTMTNPGVAGVAQGVAEAAKVTGWSIRVIDAEGTPAGIQAAFSQAVTLKPSGIVVGGFDPGLTAQQVAQAQAAHIPLIGWHAVRSPGPSTRPGLFTNITTEVEDVAKVSADWIIAHSNGNAGVVVFTDDSIPFARNKSELIRQELATCSGVRILAYENIPIPDASSRTPQEVSSLLARFQGRWTYSVAINDLYFADAAPALRATGKPGSGAPFNIGAGDGDPSAFQRINSRQLQAATVPEPLSQQGWQIVDEFNRSFAGRPASGYVAPVHIATAANSGGATTWNPSGFREAYRKIWRG